MSFLLTRTESAEPTAGEVSVSPVDRSISNFLWDIFVGVTHLMLPSISSGSMVTLPPSHDLRRCCLGTTDNNNLSTIVTFILFEERNDPSSRHTHITK